MHEVKLPQLGQSVEEAAIVQWLKQEGDAVQEGEPLYTVQTDKAEIEFTILRAGKKKTITVKPAKRPEKGDAIKWVMPDLEELDLPDLPKEHKKKIEELMKQIEAGKLDGLPHRFHHIGPGVVIEGAVAGSKD